MGGLGRGRRKGRKEGGARGGEEGNGARSAPRSQRGGGGTGDSGRGKGKGRKRSKQEQNTLNFINVLSERRTISLEKWCLYGAGLGGRRPPGPDFQAFGLRFEKSLLVRGDPGTRGNFSLECIQRTRSGYPREFRNLST